MDVETGTVNLNRAFSLSGGTLNFGLGGPATHGTLNLSSSVAISGTVGASLVNGLRRELAILSVFSPMPEKAVFSPNTSLPLGFTWTTNYGAQAFTIAVIFRPHPPPGVAAGGLNPQNCSPTAISAA